MTARVLVADYCCLFRHGMKAMLESGSDLEVVGECADGADIAAACSKYSPDLLVTDLAFSGRMSGMEALWSLMAGKSKIPIVVVTFEDTPAHLRDVFAAGARAYVSKDASDEELRRAVSMALRGDVYVDPKLMPRMVNVFTRGPEIITSEPDQHKTLAAMTPREREICGLIARGFTNREMSSLMNISKRTVETHRRNLMGKLPFGSRAELVQFAINQGLFQPG